MANELISPPIHFDMLDKNGKLSQVWIRWFNLVNQIVAELNAGSGVSEASQNAIQRSWFEI